MTNKLFTMRLYILLAVLVLASCNNNPEMRAGQSSPAKSALSQPAMADETSGDAAVPPAKIKTGGKGSFSFRLDGVLVESDPSRTKCWSTINVPLAMMMARGERMTAGWQMPYTKGQTSYRLDAGAAGASFTVDGKNYATRQKKENYINVEVTNVKEYYNVYLLSGTFEGMVQDNDGKTFTVTEGKFVTESL